MCLHEVSLGFFFSDLVAGGIATESMPNRCLMVSDDVGVMALFPFCPGYKVLWPSVTTGPFPLPGP